jgi:PIN domain nuclease of toxin-antitoxin system
MNKFNLLLNENTIIDFKVLWKLAARYRLHFLIATFVFCCVFFVNYYSQPVIYSVNVPIKVVSSHAVANDLSALVPIDTTNNVTVSELKISLGNLTFLKNFADLTIEVPSFDKMNFGSTTANKNIYGRDLKKICKKDKDCLIDQLAGNLRGIFTVDQGLTDNRFILTVNTIDKFTAQQVTGVLIKAIDINRVHVRQYLVLKEIQSVGNLINEGRSILQKMDGYKALEESEKLKNNIADLKERIRMLQYSSSVETANANSLESRLAENKKSTGNSALQSQEVFEKMQKIHSRMLDIKTNISILTNIPEDKRSPSDKNIINQLREEQARLAKVLPPEPNRVKMELSASFIENQRGKSGDFEFDYIVAKKKLEKLNQEYEESKVQLNILLQQQIANENKVISMKADLDFLKNLEAKQMSLKLLKATMTSDLYFEDVSSDAREFRQSSYSKIFMFSFAITAFLYLISLIIRYLLDDRIYGEEEVRNYLKGLDFIGEVPAFE